MLAEADVLYGGTCAGEIGMYSGLYVITTPTSLASELDNDVGMLEDNATAGLLLSPWWRHLAGNRILLPRGSWIVPEDPW